DVGKLVGNATALTGDLREAVATANRMLGQLDHSLNEKDGVGDKVQMAIQNLQQAAKGLDSMTSNLDGVIKDNRAALRDFGLRGLPQATQLVTDARSLVAELTRIADQL